MPATSPFTPSKSIAITVAATSAAAALPTLGGDQCMVSSLAGNAIAFIAFGISTVAVVVPTTQTNGIPILPGTQRVFTIPPGATHIATIGTAANTLYVSTGDGS